MAHRRRSFTPAASRLTRAEQAGVVAVLIGAAIMLGCVFLAVMLRVVG